jgi:hypothetical protein
LADRTGVPAERRLETLRQRPDLVSQRDDLTIELVDLLLATDQAAEALQILTGRTFHPWEGGEGRILSAWERVHQRLAQQASQAGDPARAVRLLEAALNPPESLAEARHPLANLSDLHLDLGDALAACGEADRASAA